MYMRNGQKKDYYISLALDVEQQNRRLCEENQKITQAMFGILKTKEELKEDCKKEVEQETNEYTSACDKRIETIESGQGG